MPIPPARLFVGPDDPGYRPFDDVDCGPNSRQWPRLRIDLVDLDTKHTWCRHVGEDLVKHNSSGCWVRDNVDNWNRCDFRDQIEVTEFNWLEGGTWCRGYADITDGTHRVEYTVANGFTSVWVTVKAHRYYPAGMRPPDRG